MSKADYPYPEDEFDAISPDAPTGVHRAPRSAWSRWWPFVVVLVVVPALAYGVVTYLSRTGDLPLAGGSPQGQEEPAGTGEDPVEDPADAEATPGPEDPPVVEPTPEPLPPDLTVPVSVLNGAGIGGLARTTAAELTAAGFTDVSPDDATGDLPDESTIYIASEDLRTTADLVATTLGVPTIEVAPDRVADGISVVLVTDPDA